MKYLIKDEHSSYWKLSTSFVITETFSELVGNCRGLCTLDKPGKYHLCFQVGDLFTPEEVQANLSKIIDAYILANPNADKAEDLALRQFAEENQQYRFLKNYKG